VAERARLSLADIRRIMVEIASESDPLLEVVAATSAGGARGSSEVVFARHPPGLQPVRIHPWYTSLAHFFWRGRCEERC